MNAPARRAGVAPSPLGNTRARPAELGAMPNAVAVGFDPVADAGQGPATQRASAGTLLLGATQRTPQLRIPEDNPPLFGGIALPPYVGWVQLFPRCVLPNVDPIPEEAIPTRVGYFNGGTAPFPEADSDSVIEWVKQNGVLFHTHFSVTLEDSETLIFGTPFSEAAPVFLPPGNNLAVFQGTTSGTSWSDVQLCYLAVIASPLNEQIMLPTRAVT